MPYQLTYSCDAPSTGSTLQLSMQKARLQGWLLLSIPKKATEERCLCFWIGRDLLLFLLPQTEEQNS